MFKLLSFALFSFIMLFTSATAQTIFPGYQEIYVNDYAAIISREDENYIRDALIELREETGIEFTVLTINSMSEYGHSGAIEPFATGLFNHWGIGQADTNDGVLMLVARHDREMRIEVGSGYGTSKNVAMKRIIDKVIIPQFKNDKYSLGIRKGTDAVIYNLVGSYPGEYGASTFTKISNRIGAILKAMGAWALLLLSPLVLWGVKIFRRLRREKPRICPIDHSKMSRLDEYWDDRHLEPGQKVEEMLKSVDYDVWECSQCKHITVEAYRAWFSGYGACRACNFRTLEGDTVILRHATKSSSGLKRIDYSCRHCDEAYSTHKTIPRIRERSSSGSSSSFGGGSSSGGGASGSW